MPPNGRSLAIYRFQRPVIYQNMPTELLPQALQDANPWGLPRQIIASFPHARTKHMS